MKIIIIKYHLSVYLDFEVQESPMLGVLGIGFTSQKVRHEKEKRGKAVVEMGSESSVL